MKGRYLASYNPYSGSGGIYYDDVLINEYTTKPAAIKKRIWRANHRESYLRRMKIDLLAVREQRLRLMDILGGRKCCDCGYSTDVRALHIDHLDNDGYKDRYLFKNNQKMYRFYLKNPTLAIIKLQVLCFNCNVIKQIEGRHWKMSSKSIDSGGTS